MQTIKRVILLYSNQTLHRLIIFSYHGAGAQARYVQMYMFFNLRQVIVKFVIRTELEWICLTFYWILELFRQCGIIFIFPFYCDSYSEDCVDQYPHIM